MRYTVDNKTIELPNSFLQKYESVMGAKFSQINFEAAYIRASQSNPKDITQEIVKQVKPSLLKEAFMQGIITTFFFIDLSLMSFGIILTMIALSHALK